MIYMTTDEWKDISELLTLNEWSVLRDRLCVNTYDLSISEQELDDIIKDYKLRTEKRFWKARRVCISTIGPIPGATECYTDTMELTLDEAKYWYKDWAKHLNDARGDKVFYGASGLFYKEGNEWIRYMVEEEYELGRIL